ncbi:MAG: hypothetical protein D6732_12115 [Methanobacteriota archaeon]|nr:MAG: hypothetical protein D6732_12115 [Euryarchaeota archaeon]
MDVCLACGRPSGVEQPTYCQFCFIPIPVAKVPKKEGYEERVQFREVFADKVIGDEPDAREFLFALGLEKMDRPSVAVALSALGMEKMHFLSSEYNWKEAERLIDFGYALAQRTGEEWAIRKTTLRLAQQEIRAGFLEKAMKHLQQIRGTDLGLELQTYGPPEQLATIFDNLEIEATLNLLKSFMKEKTNPDLDRAVSHMFSLMEKDIQQLIAKKDHKSFFQGLQDSAFSVPRLDRLCFVQSLMIQQEIAASESTFSTQTIEKLHTLGKFVILLGEMSPKDDPTFYAPQLREYIQMFNGVMWYEEPLVETDLDLTQRTILQGHATILQWKDLIPPQFWLPLRPSRFIEIFFRNMKWAKILNPSKFYEPWLNRLPKEIRPYGEYMIAEGMLRSGRLEEGMERIDKLRQAQELPEDLRPMIDELLQKTILEAEGIFLDAAFQKRVDGTEVTLSVVRDLKTDDLTVRMETFGGEFDVPKFDRLLRLPLKEAEEIMPRHIAIAGEVLENIIYSTPHHDNQTLNQTIFTVGTWYYRDVHWQTPFTNAGKQYDGVRNDVIVFRLWQEDQELSLMFEAGKIPVEENTTLIRIGTPSLYHLRGILGDFPPEKILEWIDLLIQNPEKFKHIDIYTLRIDLV